MAQRKPVIILAGKFTQIPSGDTLPPASLGTGSPSASNYLRGDGTWATPAGGGDVVGPASSSTAGLPLYGSTTGKLLTTTSQSGFVKLISGIVSVVDTPKGGITVLNAGNQTAGSQEASGTLTSTSAGSYTAPSDAASVYSHFIVSAQIYVYASPNTNMQAVFNLDCNGTLTRTVEARNDATGSGDVHAESIFMQSIVTPANSGVYKVTVTTSTGVGLWRVLNLSVLGIRA